MDPVRALLVAVAVLLGGCTPVQLREQRNQSTEIIAQNLSSELPLQKAGFFAIDQDDPSVAASPTDEQPPPLDSTPQTYTLVQAIDQALSANPDLVTQRAEVPVARSALGVAGTYPFNPTFSADVRPYTHNPAEGNLAVLSAYSLTQEIEWAGQRHLRIDEASAGLRGTIETLRSAELAVIVETERRFLTALYHREKSKLASSLADLNEETLELLRRRFEANLANGADVALARIEATTARRLAETARNAYQAALVDLAVQLGLDRPETLQIDGNFDAASIEILGTPPSAEEAVSDRSDLRAARQGVAEAQARLELAQAQQVPNVTAGPLYERDEAGTNFLGLSVSLPIPIVNTYGPLVAQRQNELGRASQRLSQLERKAHQQWQAARTRYERAQAVAAELRKDLTDGLDTQVRTVEDLYQAGQTDLLQVYAARRGVVQVRDTFLDALQELAQAAADLTAATGLPPGTVVGEQE
jgi:cobalt-zinc-cadmium efflux system outer membrane protein